MVIKQVASKSFTDSIMNSSKMNSAIYPDGCDMPFGAIYYFVMRYIFEYPRQKRDVQK